MAGVTGVRYSYNRSTSETPLFERQLGNEDYLEQQHLKMVIDNLQHRVDSLEKINTDLEYRLEDQAKQSMAVEKECMLIEQRWKKKNDELVTEINQWKKAFESEKRKGDKLREQLNRTERELYGILQRKYELIRGPGTNKAAVNSRGNLSASNDMGNLKRSDNSQTQSSAWDGNLFSTGKPSDSKRTRERKVIASLSDFLGF